MADLEVRDCTVSYGEAPVLVDADVTVPSGSMHALLGPSGSGKTTLLRAIAGFIRPETGRIVLGGRDLAGVDPAKRNIGVVFQSYALFPHLDVADNVAFGLSVRRIPRAERHTKVRDALDLVGLRGFERRKPAHMSGGQQQRVALARALVIEPELLLLDEPLSALDRKIRGEMQRELQRIHRRTGVTAIIVTHDQEEALFLADEMTILDGGRVRQAGRPAEIYDRPLDPFIAGFLGSANLTEVLLDRVGDRVTAHIAGIALDVTMLDPGGDSGTLAVRPERIRLRQRASDVSDEPSAWAIPGTIRQIDVTGPVAMVSCQVDSAKTWQVAIWGQDAGRYRAGQDVWLEMDPAGVRLFTEVADAPDR
jgi:ABC-type Fe3+/spermidine/putrescine transport system ATPase subunit